MLLRNKNLLWTPIRCRKELLQDLAPKIVMSPAAFDGELAAWNKDGGLLIYDRGYRRREDIAAHGAQVVAECPPSADLLRAFAAGTREELVIFHPPSWGEHEQWVAVYWPPSERSRRLHQLALEAPRDPVIEKALDLPPCRALSDDFAARTLEISKAELTRVRYTTYRVRDYWSVMKIAMRVPPQNREQAALFNFLSTRYPVVDGLHLVVESELPRFGKSWKKNLKALERCGAIETRDIVRCYMLDDLAPDFDHIEAVHLAARRKLIEIIAFVEEEVRDFPG